MNFDERLKQAENKGYVSVFVPETEDGGFAFFIKKTDVKVGDIVSDSIGDKFKVLHVESPSRVTAERFYDDEK
ncbi:hypothetical protein COF68_06320 [Bacillus toyonensis]|uniref:hypothetical protein n=1 Tax=Bacillus toyonensis TaxID=155322 RepID=UPI000BFCCB8B|nr:hypothetical protein [Bacillus toyonensis]PHE64449.1 hypothetical protein COF68_06320 [Bacillus toyonensis]